MARGSGADDASRPPLLTAATIKVLGRDFAVNEKVARGQCEALHRDAPPPDTQASTRPAAEVDDEASLPDLRGSSLKRMLAKASQRRRHRKKKTKPATPPTAATEGPASTSLVDTAAAAPQRLRAQQALLAFLAHAAQVGCMRPQRMLLLVEDVAQPPDARLAVQYLSTTMEEDIADLLDAEDEEAVRAALFEKLERLEREEAAVNANKTYNDMRLYAQRQQPTPAGALTVETFYVPLTVSDAHRVCLTDIQRRPRGAAPGHRHMSPNPMLPAEYEQLVTRLLAQLHPPTSSTAAAGAAAPDFSPLLPTSIKRKSSLGGVVCGSSVNGGALNLAARCAQQQNIHLESLTTHMLHHFCGLTDVLLAQNFPDARVVLPAVALVSALLRCLRTETCQYLPEVCVSTALLLQPQLWTYAARRAVQRGDEERRHFYADVKHRVFSRPHHKGNPSAAPNAATALDGAWNSQSQSQSYKGT
ncbi:hypothetical protein STCU_08333 [Strigomonas culicis]|uniref:Uncharacterized protein n=1 Tax=Strigomonas culicis TaxID=28005 RepID=S9TUQ8_9TRYP|nr:hypothetical protein STCU_08333 [Strigomonas culicis]|eukprot:EPY22132.1 hypothetical protein STCU_08333 [Strigomonas culicis]